MDILQVGSSLGIGSIAYWTDQKATRVEKTDSILCEIMENGNVRSQIQTKYFGWQIADKKIDLQSTLTIKAGSRMTRQDISISESLPNLCTGIVKHPEGKMMSYTPEEPSGWCYLATYGKQSLAEDNLGMAIFF